VSRKVVAYELLSLDGVAEGPDTFITNWDDVMAENLARVIASQDTVLLGRHTYDDWSEFWLSSEIEPFASFINGVEKFVVTSSAPDRSWSNVRVFDGDVAELVSDLTQRTGGDIGVHGSIKLTQSLLRAGLVDKLSLVIAPALHVHGRKLFDDGRATGLTLAGHSISPTGHLLLDYEVNR
jgi:dihydrofolate reductase